jgi:hypothetical protein
MEDSSYAKPDTRPGFNTRHRWILVKIFKSHTMTAVLKPNILHLARIAALQELKTILLGKNEKVAGALEGGLVEDAGVLVLDLVLDSSFCKTIN